MSSVALESKFAGALLGTFVGDVLGAPYEGLPVEGMVQYQWDGDLGSLTGLIRQGRYTDDTQMMIGVAESLVEHAGFDAAHMAHRFVENYEPYRGYGSGAHRVLTALCQGCPWDEAATSVFPDGSFGNGAAMRVAPVGALYHHDLDQLRRVAEGSAAITHAHPLGKEGAALQACAVAAVMSVSEAELSPTELLGRLRRFVTADLGEFSSRLDRILISK